MGSNDIPFNNDHEKWLTIPLCVTSSDLLIFYGTDMHRCVVTNIKTIPSGVWSVELLITGGVENSKFCLLVLISVHFGDTSYFPLMQVLSLWVWCHGQKMEVFVWNEMTLHKLTRTNQSNPSKSPFPLSADVSWMEYCLSLILPSPSAFDIWKGDESATDKDDDKIEKD